MKEQKEIKRLDDEKWWLEEQLRNARNAELDAKYSYDRAVAARKRHARKNTQIAEAEAELLDLFGLP